MSDNSSPVEEEIRAQCEELGRVLGLEAPVSREVLQAAVADSGYASNLLVARGQPRFLNVLLARPPRPQLAMPSLRDLAVSAAASLSRWACTGFSTVSEECYAARLNACAACPNLSAPPEQRQWLYTLAGASPGQRAVCSKCGCVVTTKARLTHETCPDPDPANRSVNRWNEPHPATKS